MLVPDRRTTFWICRSGGREKSKKPRHRPWPTPQSLRSGPDGCRVLAMQSRQLAPCSLRQIFQWKYALFTRPIRKLPRRKAFNAIRLALSVLALHLTFDSALGIVHVLK